MRSRIAVAVLAMLVLAGCGVPENTGITPDGPVPQRGAQAAGGSPLKPNSPNDARTPEELVRYSLQAAAGGADEAPERLRAFLTAGAAGSWQPGTAITIVRVVRLQATSSAEAGETVVDVTMHPVGRLNDSGVVEPTDQRRFTWSYQVVPAEPGGSSRLYIAAPPQGMYLDSSALTRWYQPHSIYFWASAEEVLIPDLRYLPLAKPQAAWATEIVSWLLNGPSEWLQPAVKPLPSGIKLNDSVVVSGDRLVVNLSAEAAAVDPDRLLTQLRWSLRDVYSGPVTLQVERQTRADDAGEAYVARNPATRLIDPHAYCIVQERVVPLTLNLCDPGAPVPSLAPETNVRVISAAITRNEQWAAIVQRTPSGRSQLVVSQERKDQKPLVTAIGAPQQSMGRPAWLTGSAQPDRRGLVPINGKLFEFSSGLREVETGLSGITAVAIAPGARRIALVAGGRPYVATVGPAGRPVSVGVPRLLTTTLLTSVGGIGWSQEDRVVVGGRDSDGAAVSEITVDGAVEEPFQVELGGLMPTALSALPNDPLKNPAPGQVLMDANGSAWRVFVFSHDPLQIAGGSAPPASPSGQANTPKNPTAAFYAS